MSPIFDLVRTHMRTAQAACDAELRADSSVPLPTSLSIPRYIGRTSWMAPAMSLRSTTSSAAWMPVDAATGAPAVGRITRSLCGELAADVLQLGAPRKPVAQVCCFICSHKLFVPLAYTG